jgi:cell wall integrity and stress response component
MFPSSSRATSLAAAFIATIFMAYPAHAIEGALTPTYQGCYSSSDGLVFQDTFGYQSSGHCQGLCFPQKKAVMAMTGGSDCYCGDLMPPLSAKVDDSNCNAKCNGFPADNCMYHNDRCLLPTY